VEGRNDERPRFQRARYYFNASESALPATAVGRVSALDADATPRYARVIYRIRSHPRYNSESRGVTGTGSESGDEGAFEVDIASGEVRIFVINHELLDRPLSCKLESPAVPALLRCLSQHVLWLNGKS